MRTIVSHHLSQTMEEVASFNSTNDTKVLLMRDTRLWIGTSKVLQIYDAEVRPH